MSNEKNQKLMEKIARLLHEEKSSDEAAFIRQSLEKINQRLDNIESQIVLSNPKSPIPNPKPVHPSQEKLRIIEEIVEELFSTGQLEKACIIETNKPCDNCSMCNSRGF
jgi:hypothetical protein